MTAPGPLARAADRLVGRLLGVPPVRTGYARSPVSVPVRDGVLLAADHWSPATEADDGHDTVARLRGQPWFDGRRPPDAPDHPVTAGPRLGVCTPRLAGVVGPGATGRVQMLTRRATSGSTLI